MPLYIDGLSDIIRTVVARFRETMHRREITFKIMVHFAKSKNDAYRARVRHLSKDRVNVSANVASSRSLPLPRIEDSSKKVGSVLHLITTTNDEMLYADQTLMPMGTGEPS